MLCQEFANLSCYCFTFKIAQHFSPFGQKTDVLVTTSFGIFSYGQAESELRVPLTESIISPTHNHSFLRFTITTKRSFSQGTLTTTAMESN